MTHSTPHDHATSTPSWQHNPIQGLYHSQYRGVHWINASAGTGKTFTLSAMIVRLLSSRYLPKQIIATTFTRKAVSELRQRVRRNLQEILEFFQQHRGKTSGELAIVLAEISQPLLHLLADEFQDNIGYLCERLNLALEQYDELYIGTLDSLTQKILREFRFESGQTQLLPLSEQQNQLLYQVVHDGLRAWIQQQPASLIEQLYQQHFFKSVDDYFQLLKTSLNFKSAEWQTVSLPETTLLNATDIITQFQAIDFTSVQQCSAFQKLDSYSRKRVEKIAQYQQIDWQTSPEQLKTLSQRLQEHQEKIKFLKSATEQEQQQILQHPTLLACSTLLQQLQVFFQQCEQYQLALKSFLIQYTQQHFSARLQQQQETTFTEQTQQLLDVLTAPTGDALARVVQHRYPVILVDEFQDTNHDQEHILASIWRHPERLYLGCMVMVGDDKQAIYNFRGGDMLIYRRVEQQVLQLAQQFPQWVHCYTLTQNFRSTSSLVQQLNQFFSQRVDFGEGVKYIPVYSEKSSALIEQGVANLSPLRTITLEQNSESEMIEQCVWQILQLLQYSEDGTLYIQHLDDEQRHAISVNDIAVLSANNQSLDVLHQRLLQHHIPVYRQGYQSVFSHFIARDVAHLLNAMLFPYHEDKLKRVLYSRLCGLTISQVIEMEQSQQLSRWMQILAHSRELWFKRGFLFAWQYVLNQLQIWHHLVDAVLAHERERCVVNLRHLTDILTEYSQYYHGAHHLLTWYEQQLNHPQQREWEMERKLSNSEGVQLLTIHKSKGLEFKIVFLLFANKKSNDTVKADELIFSVSADQQRMISLSHQSDVALQAHQERKLAEQHRLWYVALTRASYRVYALLQQHDEQQTPSTFGIDFWRCASSEDLNIATAYAPLNEAPHFHYRNKQGQAMQLLAQPVPTQTFYAQTRTSFTRLTESAFHKHHQLHTTDEPQHRHKLDDEYRLQALFAQHTSTIIHDNTKHHDDEYHEHQPHATPLLWIQQHFPKGAQAGILLHHILEQLDFQQIVQAQHQPASQQILFTELERCFKHGFHHMKQQLIEQYLQPPPPTGIPSLDSAITLPPLSPDAWHTAEQAVYQDILEWLSYVVSTPILPQFCLYHLQQNDYLHELQFCLALQQQPFDSEKIEQLFADYDMPIHIQGRISDQYLVGAIDVVFFDGHRYHLIDYKSNYLGDEAHHYHATTLQRHLFDAQYHLQASMYLIALHRYLKANLQAYDIQQHLGNAYYLYLRGMTGQAEQGIVRCPIPIDLIIKLDQYLGYYHAN